jgi:hypothetical protein
MDVQKDPTGVNLLRVFAPEYDAVFEVYGSVPVQAFGTVLGRDLYFHARGKSWTFDVADHNGHLPSDGYRDTDGFFREGPYPDAGWMPLDRAVNIIVRCLRQYTGVPG